MIDVFSELDNKFSICAAANQDPDSKILMEKFIYDEYVSGAQLTVCDTRRNFDKLGNMQDGMFVNIGKSRFIVNPFNLECGSTPTVTDICITASLLSEMIEITSYKSMGDMEWNILRDAVRFAYSKNQAYGIDFVSHYLSSFPKYATSDLNVNEGVSKIYAKLMVMRLTYFTSQGLYGHLFNGKENVDLFSPRILFLDMSEIDDFLDVRNIIVMSVLKSITQNLNRIDLSYCRLNLFDASREFLAGRTEANFSIKYPSLIH